MDKTIIKHIADLARIGLSDKELVKVLADIPSIIKFVEELSVVGVLGVEPMSNVSGLSNSFSQKESVLPGLREDLLIQQAPCQKNGAVCMPKII